MNKVNTKAVREQGVNILKNLRELVAIYVGNDRDISRIEGNGTFSREYKDGQVKTIKERTTAVARKSFDALQQHLDDMLNVMRENDNVYDFSDPEFASCIALISAAERPLSYETILGIAGKFLGNRQALLALVEVAKGNNKDTLNKMIFNTEAEADRLQNRLIDLDINFPKSILSLPSFKDDIVRVVQACGEEFTESEKDLGADYRDIVVMQMRAAMGLPY